MTFVGLRFSSAISAQEVLDRGVQLRVPCPLNAATGALCDVDVGHDASAAQSSTGRPRTGRRMGW